MIQLPRITYESLLRSYPKTWRGNGRADEVLAIMLEDAEARGRREPTLRESLDVIGHGLLVRLRSVDLVLPVEVRLAVVRLSLVLGTVFALFCLIFGEVRIPGLSSGTVPSDIDLGLHPAGAEFMTVGGYVYLGWAAMLGLYLAGQVRAYRYLGVGALVGTGVLPIVAGLLDRQRPPGSVLLVFVLLNVLALLPAPALERGRARMAAATAALLASLVALRLYGILTQSPAWGDKSAAVEFARARFSFYWMQNGAFGASDLAQLIAPYVVAAGLLVALVSRRRCWLAAAGIVSVPFVALRAMGNPDVYGHFGTNLLRATTETVLFTGVVLLISSPLFRRRKRV